MASEAAEPSHCVDIVLGSSGPENGGAPLDALWDLDEETCVPPLGSLAKERYRGRIISCIARLCAWARTLQNRYRPLHAHAPLS